MGRSEMPSRYGVRVQPAVAVVTSDALLLWPLAAC